MFVITFSYKEIRRIKQEILSKDVVKGDIVLLEAGDMIVADGRCLKPNQLDFSQKSHEYLLLNAILNNESSIKDVKGIIDFTKRKR